MLKYLGKKSQTLMIFHLCLTIVDYAFKDILIMISLYKFFFDFQLQLIEPKHLDLPAI